MRMHREMIKRYTTHLTSGIGVTEEDPKEGKALIRTIFHAILFEMSMVTRAAYPDTEALVESRSWEQTTGGVITPKRREYRWR